MRHRKLPASPTIAKRPTLRDIAEAAGVSVSTVSLVLSGKGAERRISSEVEARVQAAARDRDYSPNLLVRSMQAGRTFTLSFFNAFDFRDRGDLYQDGIFSAIERAADSAGYDILLHSRRERAVEQVYASLNGGRSDGLLFFGPNRQDPLLALLRSSRLPTVILNHRDEAGLLSSVCDDMESGMRQVADRLVSLGHRRIAAIAGPPEPWPDAPERIAALRAALAVHGIPLPETRVVRVYDDNPVPPEEVIRTLLAEPDAPTAAFCWHDRVGYTVLEACERIGVRVPDDLSLIGYDGLHWPSTSSLRLASVAVDIEEMAVRAIALLDALITGRDTAPAAVTYPVVVSPGDTLGPPRDASPASPMP